MFRGFFLAPKVVYYSINNEDARREEKRHSKCFGDGFRLWQYIGVFGSLDNQWKVSQKLGTNF